MAEVASHLNLKNALLHHREETQVQKDRVESILLKHGADPQAHVDQAMEALLRETEKMLAMLKGNDLRDAGLIASAQKLEHSRWRHMELQQRSQVSWIFATIS
jgi:ferritin-like metal-binding protein YciE